MLPRGAGYWAGVRVDQIHGTDLAQQLVSIMVTAVNRGFGHAGTTSHLFDGHAADAAIHGDLQRGLHQLAIRRLAGALASEHRVRCPLHHLFSSTCAPAGGSWPAEPD